MFCLHLWNIPDTGGLFKKKSAKQTGPLVLKMAGVTTTPGSIGMVSKSLISEISIKVMTTTIHFRVSEILFGRVG